MSALRGIRTVDKRGAVNWTVGKLINIILLVVVLVLIIYGVTTKSLGPLKNNIELRIKEVLILLGFGSDSLDRCYSVKVLDMGGGEYFLKELGLEGEDVVLNVCGGVCNLSGKGLSEFRVVEGRFERLEGGKWTWVELEYKEEDLSKMKFDWELYNEVVDILTEDVLRLFDKWRGDRLGVISEYFELGEFARESFREAEACDDCGRGSHLCRNIECYAISVKLGDSCEYIDHWWRPGYCDKVEDEPEEAGILDKSKEDIVTAFDGIVVDKVKVEDVEYNVGLEFEGRDIIVSFVAVGSKFGLKQEMGGDVSLVRWTGSSWVKEGDEKYYKLPKNDFDRGYKEGMVSQLLKSQCR